MEKPKGNRRNDKPSGNRPSGNKRRNERRSSQSDRNKRSNPKPENVRKDWGSVTRHGAGKLTRQESEDREERNKRTATRIPEDETPARESSDRLRSEASEAISGSVCEASPRIGAICCRTFSSSGGFRPRLCELEIHGII